MSPDHARIFYVDDDLHSLKSIERDLNAKGHKVDETATSLKEALEKIPLLGETDINVAIVDGCLTPNGDGVKDGTQVIQAIKDKYPLMIVIGHALEKKIPGAKIHCPKIDGSTRLCTVVTEA